jgi:hypothetical protein
MVVQGLFDLGVFQTSWLVLWSEWYSDELTDYQSVYNRDETHLFDFWSLGLTC